MIPFNKYYDKFNILSGILILVSLLLEAFNDIRSADVDVLTLGQYMRPTINHLPVAKWYSPEEFSFLKEKAISLGFLEVASGPMVRSSYRADRIANLIK